MVAGKLFHDFTIITYKSKRSSHVDRGYGSLDSIYMFLVCSRRRPGRHQFSEFSRNIGSHKQSTTSSVRTLGQFNLFVRIVYQSHIILWLLFCQSGQYSNPDSLKCSVGIIQKKILKKNYNYCTVISGMTIRCLGNSFTQ